jgi:Zn-finger nucleic acid-binding protein
MHASLHNNEEVCKCPKCEGLWLDAKTIRNIFDLSSRKDNLGNHSKLMENTSNIHLNRDYYYYKKPFIKNANPDDVIGFE